MIAESRKKAKTRLHEAQLAFRAELIDQAMEIAAKRLTQEIQDTDQEKMLNEFVDHLETTDGK